MNILGMCMTNRSQELGVRTQIVALSGTNVVSVLFTKTLSHIATSVSEKLTMLGSCRHSEE